MLLSEVQSLRAGDEIWEVGWSFCAKSAIFLKCFFVRKHCDDVECDLFAVERVKNESNNDPLAIYFVHVGDVYSDLESAKAGAVADLLQAWSGASRRKSSWLAGVY